MICCLPILEIHIHQEGYIDIYIYICKCTESFWQASGKTQTQTKFIQHEFKQSPSRAGGSSQNVLQLKPQIGTSSWDPCTWEWSGMTMKHQGTWRWCDLLAKDEHFNVIITWNYMNIDFTEVPLNRCPLTCDWSVGSLSTNPGYGHYKICPEVNRASWFRNGRNGWQHI